MFEIKQNVTHTNKMAKSSIIINNELLFDCVYVGIYVYVYTNGAKNELYVYYTPLKK